VRVYRHFPNYRKTMIRKTLLGSRLNIAGLMVGLLFTGQVWAEECEGVVFAVNGSGDFQITSTALERAVGDAGLPLEVITVEWSQGSVVADHTDWERAQEQGYLLASRVASYRQTNPGHAIYLVAHSAGTGVALTAAAAVPPGSVNRMILFAPSVSTDYDLRPALRGTIDGIDVFYSRRDVFSLGFGVAFIGTSDGGQGCQAAGRFGFHVQAESPEDEVLYAKLQQHPWERCQARAGNHGLHSGTSRQRFLHTFVLPLLDSSQIANSE
jgi:pimeloyl-ACP methyl ester carboxylesterase